MMYYNVMTGCLSRYVTLGALQVVSFFYCLQVVVVALIVEWDGLPVWCYGVAGGLR